MMCVVVVDKNWIALLVSVHLWQREMNKDTVLGVHLSISHIVMQVPVTFVPSEYRWRPLLTGRCCRSTCGCSALHEPGKPKVEWQVTRWPREIIYFRRHALCSDKTSRWERPVWRMCCSTVVVWANHWLLCLPRCRWPIKNQSRNVLTNVKQG